MISLIIVGIIFAYIFVGSAVYAKHEAKSIKECTYKNHWGSPACGHAVKSFWLGVLWMLAIPSVMGFKVGGLNRVSMTEKRHQRELSEAEHRKQIAKINAEALVFQEQEAGIR